MLNKYYILIAVLFAVSSQAVADTVPTGFLRQVEWRLGTEISPAAVLGTNRFLRGYNVENKSVNGSFSGSIRADFSFNPKTREGILYKGLYQGIGVGGNTFFANSLLGTPVSAYVYQGAPIAHFSNRIWFGYEWQFGAAFGWKHYDEETAENNAVVSTPVTAYMGISFKLHYRFSDCWQMSMGIAANHYSNGNTSWPNAGVNSVGAMLGIAYTLNPLKSEACPVDKTVEEDADRHCWFYDIMVFGSWRKRIVYIGNPIEPELCPGKFGIIGLQFSPLYRLNRWVAVGPALDMQWDESAGLAPYLINESYCYDVKFVRPPFGKQLSVGVSAHAELTMPIFSVNAGIGYDIVNPEGNKAFYQSLALKTFITKRFFVNVGYRLGSFKDPQNLMLGVGIRP